MPCDIIWVKLLKIIYSSLKRKNIRELKALEMYLYPQDQPTIFLNTLRKFSPANFLIS